MSDIFNHLAAHGWAWVSSRAAMQALCEEVYGSQNVSKITLVVQPNAASTVYALGNPVDYMMLYNCMGDGVPLCAHRLWWRWLQPQECVVILRDSHRPPVSHGILASGVPLPMHWTAGPQQTSHIPVNCGTYHTRAVTLNAEVERGLVVLDNTLVASSPCSPITWEGWQPMQWAGTDAPLSHLQPTAEPELHRKECDWWEVRQHLQRHIVRHCIQSSNHTSLLTFDELALAQRSTAIAALDACLIQHDRLHRFFEPIPDDPGFLKLRGEPLDAGCGTGSRERPSAAGCLSTACPRGELLHRLCAEAGLYRVQELRIQGFQNMESLLMPFGPPQWDGERKDIRLPPVLRRSGCSSIHINRDAELRGHFVQFPRGDVVDFDTLDELVTALSVHAPCLTLRRHLVSDEEDLGTLLITLSIHQHAQDLHAVLTALYCYLNPLLLLDEAVSLAVASCMLILQDNRTMFSDDLVVCHAWHRRCWTSMMEPGLSSAQKKRERDCVREAPAKPIVLNISQRHRRGFLNIPAGKGLLLYQQDGGPPPKHRGPRNSNRKAVLGVATVYPTENKVKPLPRMCGVRRQTTRTILAMLSKQNQWHRRLQSILQPCPS